MKPSGLFLRLDVISPEYEQELVVHISNALSSVPSREWCGRTKMCRYGWDYDRDIWVGEIPQWVPVRIATTHGQCLVDSVTVNYYAQGAGIHPHIDSNRFGDPVVVLNLFGHTELLFEREGYGFQLYVPPRSLTIMSGASRYLWTHSIKPVDYDVVDGESIPRGDRWSIVFRKRISHTHQQQNQ